MLVCPTKFLYARGKLPRTGLRILDVGCGNNSPSMTKHWFPGCHYAGADIENYNNSAGDVSTMDVFYQLGTDGSGYSAIPEDSYDYVILHHVVEHMPAPAPILATLCTKLKPGGCIWIAFPSRRSLSLPSAEGTLQFSDDPTHVHVPDVREISNVLLAHGVKIIHAGRSRSFIREVTGLATLPLAYLRKLATGKLSGRGLWYILGFEDHVLGQRRMQS
ncbi:class I SAM-dependent methyltransferase [Terriglobus sp.]|uniref:class I SAM-dependent methyltransferase n=1 Tax=Terriglobus sp. TaxID=1889013 RepID=UPI003B00E6BA